MINPTLSINNAQPNAFKDFRPPADNRYILLQQEDKKNHSSKTGKIIVISALGVAFATIALLKGGFSKTFAKYLNNLKTALENKEFSEGKLSGFYRYCLSKVNLFLDKAQSINNLTSLKDILFQKFMWGKNGNRKFTKKIHQGITTLFNRIGRNTVNSSYAGTNKKFASLNEYILNLNRKISDKNPSDERVASILQNINSRLKNVNINYEKGFGINARNNRLKQIRETADGLYDYFWNVSFKDIKNFKSKNMYQSFIADDYILPAKMKMAREVGELRTTVTHDITDNFNAVTGLLDRLQKCVNPYDAEINKIMASLRKNMSKYKHLSGNGEAAQRVALNKEIIESLNGLKSIFANSNSPSKDVILKSAEDIEKIISSSSKGELQEILILYKQVLPREEYIKVKNKIQSAVKSLDKSIETETTRYFEKARDLRLGSAPTDIITILTAGGTVGWYIQKSKNKDEKISASLKYGIPAIGTVATALYCMARLVSGVKSMALGMVSGFLINKLGVYVDNTRKKYSPNFPVQNRLSEKAQSDSV